LIYQLFYILFSIYFISTFFISFILLVREYFFLKSPREKIKIGYFIIGFLIPFFGTIILDVLLPLIKFGEFAGITYSLYFVTFGYFFIGIGVLGYGLFIDYREVLEKIFRGLTEMVIITDREGTILMTNEITLSKFNYKKEEFIGKKIEESIKGGREEFKEISKKLKRFGDVFEKRLYFLTKARKPIPFLSSISLTKEGIIFVGQDIKEILSYQEKLKREIREKTAQLEEAKSILEIKVAARKKELADLTQSLEERVRQKTKELRERIEELEKFQKLLRGRELKMVELEKEIERLKGELAKKRIKNE
jgi:PAS domain S-box-containing protein